MSTFLFWATAIESDVLLSHIKSELIESGTFFSLHRSEIMRALLGSGAVLLVFLLLGWCLRRLIRHSGNENKSLKRQLSEALAMPVLTMAAEIGILIFSTPLLRSLTERTEENFLKLFYTIFAALTAWGLIKAVGVLDLHVRVLARKRNNALDNVTVGIVGSVIKVIIFLTTVLFVGQNIFDINISALLASAGVIGLAFALAAKDTVSNFFGTLVIVIDTPFRIGDRIECGTVCGIVREVGMRSSRIITDDGTLCTIPNSMLTNAAVFQRNRRGHIKKVYDLQLTYDTGWEGMQKALDTLHAIMDDFHGEDKKEFAPRIYFSSFGSSSLNIRAIIFFKTESFEEEELLENELNFAILREFSKASLKFAFPTQTIVISDR